MPATRSVYYSGITGGFGIPSSKLYDSLILTADGYEPRKLKIKTNVYQEITLRMLATSIVTQKQKLISLTILAHQKACGIDRNSVAFTSFSA